MFGALSLGLGLSAPSKGGGFRPADLGAALFDMWDAEDASKISLSGSAVTAWASSKNGYSASQAVGAARPVYSASSFNGRPGLTFDGSDDELMFGGVGTFPTGATPGETWLLCNQTALAADATARSAFSYGDIATSRRTLGRTVSGAVNRPRMPVGSTSLIGTGDMSGLCVLRGAVGATASDLSLNGLSVAAGPIVPATASARTRLGAHAASAAGEFFQGIVSLIAVTAPLSTDQAAQMLVYLKARGGIA